MNPSQIKKDILLLEYYIKEINNLLKYYLPLESNPETDEIFDNLTAANDNIKKGIVLLEILYDKEVSKK